MLDLESLERRIAAYDPAIGTREQWEKHVALVRQLFGRRIQMLRVIREAPASEN